MTKITHIDEVNGDVDGDDRNGADIDSIDEVNGDDGRGATDPLRSNYGSTLNGAATMWHCIMLATIWLHCATYSMAKYDDYNMAQIW